MYFHGFSRYGFRKGSVGVYYIFMVSVSYGFRKGLVGWFWLCLLWGCINTSSDICLGLESTLPSNWYTLPPTWLASSLGCWLEVSFSPHGPYHVAGCLIVFASRWLAFPSAISPRHPLIFLVTQGRYSDGTTQG